MDGKKVCEMRKDSITATEPKRLCDKGGDDINAHVVTLYEQQSRLYQQDETQRRRYFSKHPTFFGCLKCMDGRVEIPTMTKTARGIVKPYRAIGGKFELFWPAFQNSISHWIKNAAAHGEHSCILLTSHFCSVKRELGCKGWENDRDAARRHMEMLARQMGEDYGEQLVAIPTSVDTAFDELILHGPRGDISGASLRDKDIATIRKDIRRAFPQMPIQVIKDLAPFLHGNAQRVTELKSNPRSIQEMEHDERVIAIGEGFDGLTTDNFALMNSDVNPNLDSALVIAAQIIEQKVVSSAIQAMVFTNIFFGSDRGILHNLPGMDKRCAVRRSRGLQEFAQNHIRKQCPALWRSGRLHFLTAVTRESTRELEVIEQGMVES